MSSLLLITLFCIVQLPLVQSCFEGNVVQLTELIGQREDVNQVVSVVTELPS